MTDTIVQRSETAPARRSNNRIGAVGRRIRTHAHRVLFALLGSELIFPTLRRPLMRALGCAVAPTACVWGGCRFTNNNVELADEVFINVGFFHDGAATLSIDRNVRIGQNVRVITATHEIGPAAQRCRMEAVLGPVHIGEGCWIGAGATVMPGVSIAPGCVIGAGATITRSTEPNGVYVGSPARRVRDLSAD